jgi:hypothetical protein
MSRRIIEHIPSNLLEPPPAGPGYTVLGRLDLRIDRRAGQMACFGLFTACQLERQEEGK